ncbi:MAG: hypothetical protein ABEH43_05120, partial [Flavobacteriales bacterium]
LLDCLLINIACHGQSDSAVSEPEPLSFVFRPTVTLGTGNFTFYGDVGNNNASFHPTVSRLGYNIAFSSRIKEYLGLRFSFLTGKVGANERTPERNLNFMSRIRMGAIKVSYNFEHVLKPNRKVTPFILTGIEAFEFLSKGDLYDSEGNKYHYWSDGSIKDLPEDHPNAEQAKDLKRDYTYETDLRDQNLDGFGDYSESSFAIPLGIG